MKTLLLLSLAGAAGTLARYGVYTGAKALQGGALPGRASAGGVGGWGHLPLATLAVNVLGSLAFGVIWALAEGAEPRVSSSTRLVLLTGFMGAFTTFSTFAFETGQYLRQGEYGWAMTNLAANNLLGIGAFFVGLWVGAMLR